MNARNAGFTSVLIHSDSALSSPLNPGLHPRDWIAGLEKGLSMIEVFDDAHPRMTASQAGARCGLSRTAARRYLLTLQHLGYVNGDGKLFWLTPRVLRLGQSYLESSRLPRIAQPFLQRVTAVTQEGAYVSVMDGDDVIYVARNSSSRAMNTGYLLGTRVPAQVTAAGLLMLALRSEAHVASWLAGFDPKPYTTHTYSSQARMRAELERVRALGWSMSEQQLELNHRGIAVPLRDHKGNVVGALSVTMQMGQEGGEDAAARVLPFLREAAQAMRPLI